VFDGGEAGRQGLGWIRLAQDLAGHACGSAGVSRLDVSRPKAGERQYRQRKHDQPVSNPHSGFVNPHAGVGQVDVFDRP
jgi:hypothetical protein